MRSRDKGNNGEREVAKLLTEWWSKRNPNVHFVRSPSSGGWHSAPVRAGFRASGDIMTDDLEFPFTIEVKRRETWSLRSFVAGGRSPVWEWWAQACKQGVEASLTPMLWMRKNRDRHWIVLVPEAYAKAKHWPAPDMRWDAFKVPMPVCPVAYISTVILALDSKRIGFEEVKA